MKVELNTEELDRFIAPFQEAHRDQKEMQRDLLHLHGEVARLEQRLAQASTQVQSVSDGSQLINVLSNVCGALANGNKINAIKLVREVTHLGLKEAKDIVEGNYSGPGVTRVI